MEISLFSDYSIWMKYSLAIITVSLLLFIYNFVSYTRLVSKINKSYADIKRRQRIINYFTLTFVIFFSVMPFLLHSIGVNIFGALSVNESYSLEDVLRHFISSSMKVSMLITMVVLLTDNILQRIATPICIYDDTKYIEKFCLYLRSFNSDNNKEEKLICRVAKRLYPVYAIGDPNKMLQPNGADRIYVTDDVWKEAVRDMSTRSKLILLRIGQTEGTEWELFNILESNLLDRVIFIAYSEQDYYYLISKLSSVVTLNKMTLNFNDEKPIAFFIENDNIIPYTIKKSNDVEILLNDYLSKHKNLDKEYEYDLELRNHELRYLFDNTRIPKPVKQSLNWGIVSPIVNMRHWPVIVWIVFFVLVIISAIIKMYLPIYLYFLLLFLIGNRIEWATGNWSSSFLFLKHQRREAAYLWGSIFCGFVHCVILLLLNN